MVRKVDNNFVISSGGTWLPGSYETERAAKYGFRFNTSDLQDLQDEKNKTTKVITFEDLQNLRKKLKLKE